MPPEHALHHRSAGGCTEQRHIRESRGRIATCELERTLIDESMRAQGYDPRKLAELPALERDSRLREASIFASSRLAEVESRSHFLNQIHDGSADRGTHG